MPMEADRARRHTAADVLRRIDADTATRLESLAMMPPDEVAPHLKRLDREWDLDRVVESEAALTALLGLGLATLAGGRRLLLLPAVMAGALLLYATTGRYPLLPLFRRMGVRTSAEIQRERYAAKALRGDFAGLSRDAPPTQAVH